MHSKLDQYFKEEIDNQDALDVMLDENSFMDYLINRRDIVDAVEAGDDDDEIMYDDDITLSAIDDDELDGLANGDNSYINTLID